jgi:pimeloyl-ACP methyl ester carboxylesterase
VSETALDPASTAVPAWFTDALAAPVEISSVTLDGCTIRYRAWGDRDAPGVVLVHGGAAHSRWWDHVAPYLAPGRRVVALDLSGHGDSGHRAEYSLDLWAEEVLLVAVHAGMAPKPSVIGHSMGGFVALRAAARFGRSLRGVAAVDSPVTGLAPEEREARRQNAFGPKRLYPSEAAAIARFHPVPDQPSEPYVLAHVAQTSVRETPEGWSWKFDPEVFANNRQQTPFTLGSTACPVVLLTAEHGIVATPSREELALAVEGDIRVAEIANAGHHVMLDQPLALISSLRVVLADWEQ